jgi:hypothetical protein
MSNKTQKLVVRTVAGLLVFGLLITIILPAILGN